MSIYTLLKWRFNPPRTHNVLFRPKTKSTNDDRIGIFKSDRLLEELIRICHEIEPKIKVYADIVINHMANENRSDRLNFPGDAELANYSSNSQLFEENRLYGDLSVGLFSPFDFNRRGNIENDQWLDRDRVIFGDLSDLPDLMDSPWVLLQQRTMLVVKGINEVYV